MVVRRGRRTVPLLCCGYTIVASGHGVAFSHLDMLYPRVCFEAYGALGAEMHQCPPPPVASLYELKPASTTTTEGQMRFRPEFCHTLGRNVDTRETT